MKSKNNDKLYFLAILPPAQNSEEVTAVKKQFEERFQSKAALRSPPHITLHMPFRWKPENEAALHDLFQDFSVKRMSFNIRLKGYGAFAPKVIYVHVEENEPLARVQKELVRTMRTELHILNANYKDRPFRPHMTVAFRDLHKTKFHEAWKEFSEKEINHTFQADGITLLKNMEGRWHILRQYPFSKSE